MRPFASIALLGILVLAAGAQAQSLAEHAAAAAGATIGVAGGKPVSDAITKIFNNTNDTTVKAASVKNDDKTQKRTLTATPISGPASAPAGAPSAASAPASATRHASVRPHRASTPEEVAIVETAAVVTQPVLQEPVVKEPSVEDLASVKVGTSEKELLAALGTPASRITIPEEGHLLEICQYWAKGRQLGTVRLDNGQVVTVERREN